MPLSYNHNRRVLYVAAESTEGTYAGSATLFAVTNATLPPDSIKFSPSVTFTDRNPDSPSLQQIAAVPGQASGKISFTSRLTGSASAGALPAIDKMLTSALTGVATAGTSVVYSFNPSASKRLSVGYGTIAEDGSLELQHAIAGAGPSKITIKADGIGKPIMIDWEFTGKIAYDTNFVTVDDATPNTGITFIDDNTLGYRYLGLTVSSGLLNRAVSKFEFDLGIKGQLGNDITDKAGHDWFKLESCNPVLKIDPSKVSAATSSELVNLIQGASASAGFTITNAAGRTFALAIPNLQPTALSDDSVGPVSTWGITASARRSQNGTTADAADAFKITFA